MSDHTIDFGSVDLSPAELKAVEVHKYHLAKRLGREVSIEEAIRDFIGNYEQEWRRWKQAQDNLAQSREIERHKYFKSKEAGRDIGLDAAVEDWRARFAEIWRQERESLAGNDFRILQVTVANPRGLHMRPCSTIATIAAKFDCDVYVHREAMEHYNFTLNGKRYLNVKSVLGLLTMAAIQGDQLELIAHGRDAQAALDALARYIRDGILPGAAA